MISEKPNWYQKAQGIFDKDIRQLYNSIDHWLPEAAEQLREELGVVASGIQEAINEHQKRLEQEIPPPTPLPVCPECKGNKMITTGFGTTICPKCRGTPMNPNHPTAREIATAFILRPSKPPELLPADDPAIKQALDVLSQPRCISGGCHNGWVGEYGPTPAGTIEMIKKRPCPTCNGDPQSGKS